MGTYIISSIKKTEKFEGSFEEAIECAVEIYIEYQPAFGVQVENDDGEVLFSTEDE